MSQLSPASAAIDPTGTLGWYSVTYGANYPDVAGDAQAGSAELDIVGNASAPSLFKAFDDNGTASLTDGYLGFRMRLSQDTSSPGFGGVAFVGIDGDANGSIDVFVGVDNQGSENRIRVWDPGADLNISPNTTSIQNPALLSYAQTGGASGNYDWRVVGGGTPDLDGNGADYYLTFTVSFADVVSVVTANGVVNYNENSTSIFISSTATQPNALNGDLNGPSSSYDGSLTWSQLGASTAPYSASGVVPVPEPRVSWLAVLTLAGLGARRCLRPV